MLLVNNNKQRGIMNVKKVTALIISLIFFQHAQAQVPTIYLINDTGYPISSYDIAIPYTKPAGTVDFYRKKLTVQQLPGSTESINLNEFISKEYPSALPESAHITIAVQYYLKQSREICLKTEQSEDCRKIPFDTASATLTRPSPGATYRLRLVDLVDKHHQAPYGYKRLVIEEVPKR